MTMTMTMTMTMISYCRVLRTDMIARLRVKIVVKVMYHHLEFSGVI